MARRALAVPAELTAAQWRESTLRALTEKAFQAQVMRDARQFAWAAFHDAATNAPRACWHCGAVLPIPRNPGGWPDLLLVRSSWLCAVELKRQDGRMKVAQSCNLMDLSRTIPHVYVWRPLDTQAIVAFLDRPDVAPIPEHWLDYGHGLYGRKIA